MKTSLTLEIDKQEVAEMVAWFLQVPVSRIEDIDVYGDTIEVAVSGRYETYSFKRLLKLRDGANALETKLNYGIDL